MVVRLYSMRPRWIYCGLVVASTIAAFIFQGLGSTEVAGHAFFHLISAVVVMGLVWFIPRPVSAPNRWLWRGGWAVSVASWIEAVGAFGYDDRATSAVPGLHFVHNSVAPLVLMLALLLVVGSACAVAWTRLPRPAAIVMAAVVSTGGLFLIATAFGLGP